MTIILKRPQHFVTVKECVRESGERYIKRCFSYRVRKTECRFYDDIKAENYGKSYGNPTYAVEKLGEEYGQILSALYAECRKRITDVYAAKK